jgi:hypothetical protein
MSTTPSSLTTQATDPAVTGRLSSGAEGVIDQCGGGLGLL